MTQDLFKLKLDGHVEIFDAATNELIFEKKNAIHMQNMTLVVARALARESNGFIMNLALGNGGTFYNSSTQLVYRSPNVLGTSATLYNQTYSIQLDESSAGTPATSSVTSSQTPAPALTTKVVVQAQLSASEPAGQASADNLTVDVNAPFIFDEMGLVSPDGLLLTHMIFNPIEKTANRAWLIKYSITISAA